MHARQIRRRYATGLVAEPFVRKGSPPESGGEFLACRTVRQQPLTPGATFCRRWAA